MNKVDSLDDGVHININGIDKRQWVAIQYAVLFENGSQITRFSAKDARDYCIQFADKGMPVKRIITTTVETESWEQL